MKKQLSFSNIKLRQIEKLVQIRLNRDESKFEKWFSFNYVIEAAEINFLKSLLEDERLLIAGFTEEELKAKFIIPLLNKVNYKSGKLADWYERTLRTEINGYEIGGKTDFLVAQGLKEPEAPYFFLFKNLNPLKTQVPH